MLALIGFGTMMVGSALLMGAGTIIRQFYSPDEEAAKDLSARNAANQRRAMQELAMEQQLKERVAERFGRTRESLGRANLAGAQFIRSGMEDDQLGDGYLQEVAGRMGMSPDDLRQKTNPSALGSSVVGRVR